MYSHSVRTSTILMAFTILVVWQPKAHAAVIVSNIQLTETSLSFDISGTIDVVGPQYNASLFVGDPLNGAWVLHGFGIGTWTNLGGASYNPPSGYTNSNAAGGYVYTDAGGVIQVNDTVNASFSYSGGNFDPLATDTSTWIVSAGSSSSTFILPDPEYATGYVVPEPTAFAMVCLAAPILILRRRRA